MRKTALLLFILFISFQAGYARKKYTEPFLHEVIENARKINVSEKDRFNALDALVNFAHNLYPPDTTIKLINELLTLNNKIHAADPRPYLLMIKGQEYLKANKPDSALGKFMEVIDEFDKAGRIFPFNSYLVSVGGLFNQLGKQEDRLNFYRTKLFEYMVTGPSENMGACYHGMAGCYSFKGDFNQALTYYFKAMDAYRSFSQVGCQDELSVIGYTYSKWGNWKRATHYLKLADSLARRNQDSLRSQFCRMTLAIVMKDQRKYDEALQYIDSAFLLGIRSYKIENIAILHATAVDIYLQLNETEKAFKELSKLKKLTDSLDFPVEGIQGMVEVDYLFYKYYQKKNNWHMAEKHLVRAYKEADSVRSGTLMLKYQKDLFNFYKNSPASLKAVLYADDFFRLNDSLSGNQDENNIAQYETEATEKQREDEYRDLQLKKEKEQRNYITGGIFLLLILAGVFLRLWYIQKTKKQLLEKNLLIVAERENADRMRQRAEQSEHFKQQFLANMSHEIRTPMNAVMGMTNLLIDKNPRGDQQPYLDGIKKSSGILLHLLNDILDLAKIEAGKIELESIDFSLHEMVDQVIQTMRYKAEEKGLLLTGTINDSLPDVLIGDPVRLNQILVNLIGNAVKFTEKGAVQVRIEQISAGNESESPVKLKFLIIDSGIGIAKEKLNSVFEEFSQANASDTRKFGGTGLGLTISNQLVTLMSGQIRVESELGSGTTFSFELSFPRGSSERLQQQTDSNENIDGSILDGLSLLIADDNDYNLVVAGDTLRSKSRVNITTATNGREVIDLLEQNDYDAILMDVQMPVMSGFEATKYIREQMTSPKKDIPVIALTASVLRADLDRCRESGMNTCVPKPFSASQLIRGIAEVLNIPLRLVIPVKKQDMQQAPVLNEAVTDLTYLRKFCEEDRERMVKYIGMFLDSVPVFIARLKDALAANDPAEIATQVHGYKTKWVMMGMDRAKNLATGVEQQCREGAAASEVRTKVETLIAMAESAKIELKTTISNE